jgi:hypothetical protein
MKKELDHKYNVILPLEMPCPYKKGEAGYSKWVFENFIEPDLAFIKDSEHFFVLIDASFIKGAGAKSEITLAAMLNKPIVYCVYHDTNIEQINGWTLGGLYRAKRVASLKDAVDHYKDLEYHEQNSF